jgi:hypothetical protein
MNANKESLRVIIRKRWLPHACPTDPLSIEKLLHTLLPFPVDSMIVEKDLSPKRARLLTKLTETNALTWKQG